MQQGIIIYWSQQPESFERALYYKKSLPNAGFYLLADETEAAALLARGFTEIIFLPEVKDLRKALLKNVTAPAKIRLLSEQAFLTQQQTLPAREKTTPPPSNAPAEPDFVPSTPIKRRQTRQRQRRLTYLLLGGALALIIIVLFVLFILR